MSEWGGECVGGRRMEKVWNSSGEWRMSWPERRNKVSDPIKDVLLVAQLVK